MTRVVVEVSRTWARRWAVLATQDGEPVVKVLCNADQAAEYLLLWRADELRAMEDE